MSYYDESRQRLPDGDRVRTLPGQGGRVDASGWRRYERPGERLGVALDELQIGRADIERRREWSDADALVDEFGREELTKAAVLFSVMQGQ